MTTETGSTTGGQATTSSTSAALAGATTAATTTAASTTQATTTTAASTTQATTTTQTTAIPWLDGADDVTMGYATNKGWQSPKDVLTSYQNLEKLLGADRAGNTVIIPKADADPKEWAGVFDKLGRPTGPDGYKVAAPDSLPKELVATTLAKYHELGLTKAQGEALAGFELQRAADAQTARQTAAAQEHAKQDAALRQEWGQAYTQELEKARVGMRALALDSETIDKVSDAIGHQATLKLLAKVGAGLAEDEFTTGGNAPGFASAMTPGQAQAKVMELRSDPTWSKGYLAGGAAEKAEMARLMKFAYPDQ